MAQRSGLDTSELTRKLPRSTQTEEKTESAEYLRGRYRVMNTLGQGAFGKVVCAQDCHLERKVAIKQLHPDRLDDENRARFLREAKILAALDHPNVVPIYDADILEEPYFLVMKFVSGSTLKQVTSRIEYDETWVVEVLQQLAAGLDYIHQRGVLHRDLKPENIILEKDSRPVLVDFGLSRSRRAAESLTEPGHVLGTLPYMAPEALRGEYTPKSDLYSLGATLYFMLFKEPCFTSQDIGSLVAKIQGERPGRLDQPPPAVSEELVTVLKRLLCKDPSRRFRLARELLEYLDDWQGTGESASRALPLDLYGEQIEELEVLARKSLDALDSSDTHIEPALAPLSRLTRRSNSFLDQIGGLPDQDLQDPMIAALLSSIHTVGRSVDQHLRLKVDQRVEGAEGPLHQLRALLLDRVTSLLSKTRSTSTEEEISDFFSFDSPPSAGWNPEDEFDWRAALMSRDELERHEGLLAILGPCRRSFLGALPTMPEEDRRRILQSLWDQADLLLLEGRANAEKVFESVIAHCDDPDLSSRWVTLFSVFRPSKSRLPHDAFQMAISTYPRQDQRVIGRSLLIHPERDLRLTAFEFVELSDFWPVITHRLTPLRWIEEIWRRLKPDISADFKKIFFVCIRQRLMDAPLDRDISVAASLLEHFFAEDVFLERDFFRMLASLNEYVREESKRVHFAIDFLDRYVERMRSFLSSPKRQENPVGNWGSVPLPIQRMIARRGLFQMYFACHPKDPIALEVVRYLLAREDITDFLKLFRINKSLLTEVARESRYFQSEHAKFHLVANPKTPAFVIARYIDYLNQSSLKKLSESRECNPFARSHAQRLLSKRSRYRSKSGRRANFPT